MNNRFPYLLGILITISLFSCTNDKLEDPTDSQLFQRLSEVAPNGNPDHFILPPDRDVSTIPADPQNPLSQEKVQLGQFLFFETGLAVAPVQGIGEGTYSCASCHVPDAGFMPGARQGIGEGGLGFGENGERRLNDINYDISQLDVQGARPLSLINVAFSTNTSWNGQFGAHGINIGTEDVWDLDEATETNHFGFEGIESQNIEGLKLHRMLVTKELMDELRYTPLFDAAFPEVDESERYTNMTASLAISAYIRCLIPNRAPFQKWLKGDKDAMTKDQKLGANLFFDKARCYTCHKGTALNNPNEFFAIGVEDLYQNGGLGTDINDKRNLGRGGFTQEADDLYKFKVPQLYNLRNAGFYFHGSSKNSIREVVEYFNMAQKENDNVPEEQISHLFQPLELTEEEIGQLTDFLENALYDDEINRHVPPAVLSGNCFPNNDPISRIELGCE